MLLLFYNVSHIVEMVPFEVVAGGDCVISNSGGVSLKCQPSSLSYLPEEGSGGGGGGGGGVRKRRRLTLQTTRIRRCNSLA